MDTASQANVLHITNQSVQDRNEILLNLETRVKKFYSQQSVLLLDLSDPSSQLW
jgi:hypothetical protein